jgi:hypothetical protein
MTPRKGSTMSEIVLLVESITTAGWVFLCAVAAVAVGCLVLERRGVKRAGAKDSAGPRTRHAA